MIIYAERIPRSMMLELAIIEAAPTASGKFNVWNLATHSWQEMRDTDMFPDDCCLRASKHFLLNANVQVEGKNLRKVIAEAVSKLRFGDGSPFDDIPIAPECTYGVAQALDAILQRWFVK